MEPLVAGGAIRRQPSGAIRKRDVLAQFVFRFKSW